VWLKNFEGLSAWQMACASASAASAGLGSSGRCRMSAVMRSTWSLFAFPFPVMASLTSDGVCTAMGMWCSAAATIASPATCAVPRTVLTLCCAKTCSMEMMSGV